MRTKTLLGVSAFVMIWTSLFMCRDTGIPILAYPLYVGLDVHSLVVGQHQTLTWDKIGFAAELAANLAIYLVATLAIFARFNPRKLQTNLSIPDRMTLRLVAMRSLIPILSNVLRNWSVLPSGL